MVDNITVDPTMMNYGATVMTSISQCEMFDYFTMFSGNDRIFVRAPQVNCYIEFVGAAPFSEYNNVTANLGWNTIQAQHATINFGFVYWTNMYVRDMIIDSLTGHVYAGFAHRAPITLTGQPYLYDAAPTRCDWANMYVATINSAAEQDELPRIQRYGDMWLGAQRVISATNTTLRWNDGANMTYQNWIPGKPDNIPSSASWPPSVGSGKTTTATIDQPPSDAKGTRGPRVAFAKSTTCTWPHMSAQQPCAITNSRMPRPLACSKCSTSLRISQSTTTTSPFSARPFKSVWPRAKSTIR